jgi:hypothetical protein
VIGAEVKHGRGTRGREPQPPHPLAAPLRGYPLLLTNAYVFSWRLAERNGILALTASVVSTYAD